MQNQVQRSILLSLLTKALDSVQGKTVVVNHLNHSPLTGEKVAVLAIGKAAFSMLQGAVDVFGARIVTGLLITKEGHLGHWQQYPSIEFMLGGHPVPDIRSLQAGDRLVTWLDELPPGLPLLVLISGGTSSLVEKLPAGVTLSELQRLNKWLLSSGLNIGEINLVRRSISLMKGGRLLRRVENRPVTQLLISDVPGDVVGDVGSGLFVDSRSEASYELALPDWIVEIQGLASESSTTREHDDIKVQSYIIANNLMACEAVKREAESSGYQATIVSDALSGDVVSVAEDIDHYLQQASKGCYIWGGETTVQLPQRPGRGGRNQQLALLLAKQIQSRTNLSILCVGTDGSDGPTEDAGALIDSATLQRGHNEGFDIDLSLLNADAGSFLAASGDLINTGPTGTNVMDLVIALKD